MYMCKQWGYSSINFRYRLARWLVSKMVKNGIYSFLRGWVWGNPAPCGISRGSRDLPSVNTVRVRLSNKPVLGANSQKKNKNHLKPII